MIVEKPLISIIIPVYNIEKYIDKCLESIIEQTYDNIEIIVVDDGSKDKSSFIIDEWKEKDSRIKAFHKKNRGLSEARNFGIKISNGKYITFVDSVDYVNKDFISSLFGMVLKYNVKIACIGHQQVNDEDSLIEDFHEYNDVELLNTREAIENLYLENKHRDYAWNKLYEKTLFDGVEYPKGRKMEDVGTTYKLIYKCDRVAYCQTKMYYYRIREGSILHNIDRSFFIDRYYMLKQRYLFIKEKYPNLIINYVYFF